MALTPQLQLIQKQSLKLTPSMRQSIEMLQLNQLEIDQLLQKEKEENPLLDLESHGEMIDVAPKDEKIKDISAGLLADDAKEALDRDEDYNNEFDETPYFKRQIYSPAIDAGSVIEATAVFKEGLQDDLKHQICLNIKKPAERAIATFWLSQLDENGRLSFKMFDHAGGRGLSDDDLESLLARLQQLEPVGLFARNLKECLKAQLIDEEKWDPLWLNIFEHMDLLEKGQLKLLKQHLKISEKQLLSRLQYLKKLNPNPAWKGEDHKAQRIIPELKIYRSISGDWKVKLNEKAFSHVVLGQLEDSRIKDAESKKWINNKRERGRFLIRVLARRAYSILRLGEVVLQKQALFFEKGSRYLIPLTMRSIGHEMGLHESTISRLVYGKYLDFEGQIIELRWFFQSGRIPSSKGKYISAVSVQEYIKSLIGAEPQNKPYSDDILAGMLKEQNGISIARRTIAKYREAAHILSSTQRKRNYKKQL